MHNLTPIQCLSLLTTHSQALKSLIGNKTDFSLIKHMDRESTVEILRITDSVTKLMSYVASKAKEGIKR